MPPVRFEPLEPAGFAVQMDGPRLAAWCREAGLPPPPAPSGLDNATWKLVIPAIEAAARQPSIETLGALAMFYDGHAASESARELYQRIVKLAPYDAKWWHLLGRVDFELGSMDQAVSAFGRATTLAPRAAEGWGRLGEAQLAAGQWLEAAVSWRQYIDLRPEDPIGYTGLARTLEHTGDFEGALREAERAVEREPQARPALVVAARVAARMGNAKAAEAFRQSADRLSPQDDPIMADSVDLAMREHARTLPYLRKAIDYYKNHQQYSEAYRWALLLAERRPQEADSWKLLTWSGSRTSTKSRRRRHGKTALALDPQFAPGYEAIARGYIAERDNVKALAAVERALSIDPEFTHALVTRGIILAGMGKWPSALEDLEKGLKLHPEDVEGWIMLAVSRANTGNLSAAREAVAKALQLAPNHPLALSLQAKLQPK